MDTSKEYIEMCRQATEIQSLRATMNYEDGDVISFDWETTVVIGSTSITKKSDTQILEVDLEDVGEFITHEPGEVWLPRQDQLQAMLFAKRWQTQFKNMGKSYYSSFTNSAESWEQYWLMAVMLDSYQKVWFNGKWDGEIN